MVFGIEKAPPLPARKEKKKAKRKTEHQEEDHL